MSQSSRWLRKLAIWYRANGRSIFLILFTAGFIFKLYHIMGKYSDPYRYDKVVIIPFKSVEFELNDSSLKQNPACPIPQLEPFDKSIQHLLRSPPKWDCEAKYPLLFKSSLDSWIIPEKGPEHFRKLGWVSCCYRTVERVPIQEDDIRVSSQCFPLSITKNGTRIPEEHELIGIYCNREDGSSVPVDAHAFVPPPKPAKEEVGRKEEKLNVLIFGVDSMSRMNFLRNMPHSYAFLKEELEAVEMLGYNKVGDNTHPNLIPLLSSKTFPELLDTVKLSPFGVTYFKDDECPFIWKKYSDQGYSTSFNEDLSDSTLSFHLKPGFKSLPTEHYIRPLVRWADKHLLSSESSVYAWPCHGPRLTFHFLLDYLEKYAYSMGESKKNFFHFTWASSLAHDYQAGASLGDLPLLNSLKWLKGSGYLNNTLLIVMSDHGNRVEPFRGSLQGQLEDRLPGMFFVFPESFKKEYPRAYQNLLGNRDKLMTVFDVHEALLDILDLEGRIQKNQLKRRESIAANSSYSLPRGLSLFLPIPEWRTCAMAGIPINFCSCNFMRQTSLQSPLLPNIAGIGLDHINSLLKDHQPQCSYLQLHNLTLAQHTGLTSMDYEAYIINFLVKPGGAAFEAMIDRIKQGGWTVRGTIARTNRYGNQSHCVDDPELKPYCYCSDLIVNL